MRIHVRSALIRGATLLTMDPKLGDLAGGDLLVEGPKIVVDMLSYTKQNVDEDFSRAQSLVTDGYRPEVSKQQAAVREAGPVDNDYWVSNSAVLSASADRATMLMLPLLSRLTLLGNPVA
jgi:Mce-associated membrane protein